jgi:hypothetical protein
VPRFTPSILSRREPCVLAHAIFELATKHACLPLSGRLQSSTTPALVQHSIEKSVQRNTQRSTSFQHLSISCGYRPRVLTFQLVSTSISLTRITIASKAILKLLSCSLLKSTQVCPRYVSAHSSRLESASCTQRKNLALPPARCMRPPSIIPS